MGVIDCCGFAGFPFTSEDPAAAHKVPSVYSHLFARPNAKCNFKSGRQISMCILQQMLVSIIRQRTCSGQPVTRRAGGGVHDAHMICVIALVIAFDSNVACSDLDLKDGRHGLVRTAVTLPAGTNVFPFLWPLIFQ